MTLPEPALDDVAPSILEDQTLTLQELVEDSNREIKGILNLADGPRDGPDFLAIKKLKHEAAATVYRTATKVDETALKRQKQDLLPKILEAIRDEERARQARLAADHSAS